MLEEGRPIYDLEERLLEFSTQIIRLTLEIERSEVGIHVTKQVIRSGTSPLANHGEAQAAESPQDFIHKLKISLKELRETSRWLKLIQRVPLIKNSEALIGLPDETDQLIRIFVTSINTARKRAQKT